MAIDWSATGDMISGFGTLVGGLAVVWGAYRAEATIASWKRQKATERKFEHAERCLAAIYKVRSAIRTIRGPLIFHAETARARAELEQDPQWHPAAPDAEQLVSAHAVLLRLVDTEGAWDELSECLPLARALFDEDLEKALEKLIHQRWVLRTWIDAFASDRGGTEFSREIRRELFGNDSPTMTKVTADVQQSIEIAERICLPALRG